jgi:hypothetical protein
MFMCSSSSAGATVQPEPSRRLRGQPPSERGRVLPMSRRQVPSRATPKKAGSKRAAPEPAGSKRATPEQGSSDRPMKKARVRSKM